MTQDLVFISYSRIDSNLVIRLTKELRATGANAWLDQLDLPAGSRWDDEIEEALRNCSHFIIVLSRNSIASQNVKDEIGYAVDSKKQIIPILIETCEIPLRLRRFQYVDLTRISFDEGLQKVTHLLKQNQPTLEIIENNVNETENKSSQLEIGDNPLQEYFYAYPREYIESDTFIGRKAELQALDDWGKSENNILIVHAMGGMGKSALTWEWAKKHASNSYNPEGVLWFNFYEKGATFETFIFCALGYITRQDMSRFKSLPYEDAARQLLKELRQRKILIILDGLERILVAYHRLDSAHLKEGEINESPVQRKCIEQSDDDFLQQLANCAPSKVIISTRLIPSAFEQYHQHLPRVQVYSLIGLQPEDGVVFALSCGIIKANEDKLSLFLSQFGYHPVLIKTTAGIIKKNHYAAGDFDDWHDRVGQYMSLSELEFDNDSDPYRKVTVVLNEAIQGLTRNRQLVLAMLAVYGDAIDAPVFADELNPYLPEQPKIQELPKLPAMRVNPLGSRKLAELERQLHNEYDDEKVSILKEQIENQKQLDETVSKEIEKKQSSLKIEKERIISKRQKNVEKHRKSSKYLAGIRALDKDITDLTDRGLLDVTYDQDRKVVYDLHPLVRAHVTDMYGGFNQTVTNEARQRVLGKLSKHSNMSQNELLIEFRNYIASQKFEDAASLYINHIANKLYDDGQFHKMRELVESFFEDGIDNLPSVKRRSDQAYLITDLAIIYTRMGNYEISIRLFSMLIPLRMEIKNHSGFVQCLMWLSEIYTEKGNFKEAQDLDDLLLKSGEHINRPDLLQMIYATALKTASLAGQWDRAEDLLNKINEAVEQKIVDPNDIVVSGNIGFFMLCSIRYSIFRNLDAEKYFAILDALPYIGFFTKIKTNYYRAIYNFHKGEYTLALNNIDDALRQAHIAGIPLAPYLALRGEVLLAKGYGDEAKKMVISTLEDISACGIVDCSDAYNSLARIEYNTGNLLNANLYAQKALEIACKNGSQYLYYYGKEEAEKILERNSSLTTLSLGMNINEGGSFAYINEIREYINHITPENRTSESKRISLKIKSVSWFQIGVIACFGVIDDDQREKMTQLAHEIYSLSDDPGPIEITGTDQLVDPNPSFSYLENCVEYKLPEELDLKFIRQGPRHDVITVALVGALSEDNEVLYFFMSLRSEKVIAFCQKRQSNVPFDVSEYGNIINSPSSHPPTKDDVEYMFDNWLFCPYFLPVKLIGREAGGS